MLGQWESIELCEKKLLFVTMAPGTGVRIAQELVSHLRLIQFGFPGFTQPANRTLLMVVHTDATVNTMLSRSKHHLLNPRTSNSMKSD